MAPWASADQQALCLYSTNQQKQALTDLNFSFERGQSIALVGESGAGKSTAAAAPRMLWTQGMVAVGCLALVGMPPLANFFPIEELLAFIATSERMDRWLLIAIVLVGIGTLSFAIARAYFLIFWGNVRQGGIVEDKLRDPTGWT